MNKDKIKEEVLKTYENAVINVKYHPSDFFIILGKAIDLTLEKAQEEQKKKVEELRNWIDECIYRDERGQVCFNYNSTLDIIKREIDEIFGDEK
jgi:hypothetical protein